MTNGQSNVTGTLQLTAPELMLGGCRDCPCDVYSYGMIQEMAARQPPYNGMEPRESVRAGERLTFPRTVLGRSRRGSKNGLQARRGSATSWTA